MTSRLKSDVLPQLRKGLEENSSTERLRIRKQGEESARQILNSKLGSLDEQDILSVQSGLSQDFHGKPIKNRFGLAFTGNNAKSVARNAQAFNRLANSLWRCDESDISSLLDDYWQRNDIPGAGISIPSAILYLRDPNKWGIWTKALENGVAHGIEGYRENESHSGQGYLNYNEGYLAVKDSLDIEPELVDLAIWVLQEMSRHVWDTIATYEQLQDRIKLWSDGFLSGEPIAVDGAPRSSHWYYSPEHDTFGPSKFIGYQDMPFDKYSSSRIDGVTTQRAIHDLKKYRKLEHDSVYKKFEAALSNFLSKKGKTLRKTVYIHVPINLQLPSEVDDNISPATEDVVQNTTSTSYNINSIVEDGCFIEHDELEKYLERLQTKKNLILQGPPGTGKTWLAKRLAYAHIGEKNPQRIRAVQFHPNLSYEDFIRGYRPNTDASLSIQDGPFMKLVADALAEQSEKFVLVIEEINRGNPAQIFGEMLTLLEADKRCEEEALELSYSNESSERVYIPENVYVIGTMNIADRSLALVDLALRRRFAFVDLYPRFNGAWEKWITDRGVSSQNASIIRRGMETLNAAIKEDPNLGQQFMVGHSYVTPTQTIQDVKGWFKQLVETEIAPLLEEYWFDDRKKALDMKKALLDVF